MPERDENPVVSVVMTAYNSEKFIEEAVLSILNQKYPALEIIVVDDGSEDGTHKLIRSYRDQMKIIYQKHSGIAAGWNRGVDEASGLFLSFLDADDLWTEDKISKQLSVFSNNPEVDISFGHAVQFREPSEDSINKNQERVYTKKQPGISAGTIMIKRQAFEQIGRFNKKWSKGIFMDWYMQAKEFGLNVHMHPDVFLRRRVHDSNHGVLRRDKYQDYVRMLKESLDRKRENPET